MDLNELRISVTLLTFATFVGIAAWAWSQRQVARFDEAAQLPFVAEGRPAATRPTADEKAVSATLADAAPRRRGIGAERLP